MPGSVPTGRVGVHEGHQRLRPPRLVRQRGLGPGSLVGLGAVRDRLDHRPQRLTVGGGEFPGDGHAPVAVVTQPQVLVLPCFPVLRLQRGGFSCSAISGAITSSRCRARSRRPFGPWSAANPIIIASAARTCSTDRSSGSFFNTPTIAAACSADTATGGHRGQDRGEPAVQASGQAGVAVGGLQARRGGPVQPGRGAQARGVLGDLAFLHHPEQLELDRRQRGFDVLDGEHRGQALVITELPQPDLARISDRTQQRPARRPGRGRPDGPLPPPVSCPLSSCEATLNQPTDNPPNPNPQPRQ